LAKSSSSSTLPLSSGEFGGRMVDPVAESHALERLGSGVIRLADAIDMHCPTATCVKWPEKPVGLPPRETK